MIKKIGLSLACVASLLANNSVELNINDKDFEIGARVDLSFFNDSIENNVVFIGGKFLHGDESYSDLKDPDDYAEVNFLMQREIDAIGLNIGLGVKANFTKDFASFPLGAEANYRLPVGETIPMYVGAMLYYAPSVLTTRDGDNFLEYRVEFSAEVIRGGSVYAGYRNLDTNYKSSKGGDANYNSAAYFGFRFSF